VAEVKLEEMAKREIRAILDIEHLVAPTEEMDISFLARRLGFIADNGQREMIRQFRSQILRVGAHEMWALLNADHT
jgi:hypothetical protein